MEQAEFESYEIYKNHPEAFTMANIADEQEALILEALLEEQQQAHHRSKRRGQLYAINAIPSLPEGKRGKNKGKKKRERGKIFAQMINEQEKEPTTEYHPWRISEFLKKTLPKSCIRRSSGRNVYVFCPFHQAGKTGLQGPSLRIRLEKGTVKCYGCGKSHRLSTFLSITQGQSKHYREQKLAEASETPLRHEINEENGQ